MPNRLAREVSPYLLQHQDNPVDWWPWHPDALAEAKRTNRPILLSVGYAACHWCHVMAHESFENDEIAAVMNRLFVNIKVDREERPDIDQIYMAALHTLGEQGGWPLTMFLTPEATPIWGGTYFPPTSRYGRPGFPDVLREVARIYHEEPDRIASISTDLMNRITATPTSDANDTATPHLNQGLLDLASTRLAQLIDPDLGGTRGAPKFPQISLFECIMRAGTRTGQQSLIRLAQTTANRICQGGIYDHIGGGFARYSVDERWLVPHFEKMLYDNAQLIEWLAFLSNIDDPGGLFRTRIDETVAWLRRELTTNEGGFAASIDADSEGEEGRFYVWTRDQLDKALDPQDAAHFAETYNIRPDGNWEGKAIPNLLTSPTAEDIAVDPRLGQIRHRLLQHRDKRVRPATDDKILADWNGLAIAALATAGFIFDRSDYIELAKSAYRFVKATMTHDNRLAHAYRAGRTVVPALATDYAYLTKGALALYETTGDPTCLDDAIIWTRSLKRHHWRDDPAGLYLSANDAEALITRPNADHDDATPSATSIAIRNLIHLWHLTGDDAYREDADTLLDGGRTNLARNLYTSASYLNAFDLRLGARTVVIISDAETDPSDLMKILRRTYDPNMIIMRLASTATLPGTHPAHGKDMIDGRPTAYVCREGACSLPATEPEDFRRIIASAA